MPVPNIVPQINPAIKSHLSFDLYTDTVSLLITYILYYRTALPLGIKGNKE